MILKSNKIRVCLILEGSYPYIRGGVSQWVHQLIDNLREIQFILLLISDEKETREYKYSLPPNVESVTEVYLRGEENHKGYFKQKKRRDGVKYLISFLQHIDGDNFKELKEVCFNLRDLSDTKVEQEFIHCKEIWELLLQQYCSRFFLAPFSNYFWTWYSSHQILLRMLFVQIPSADIYHSLSTGYSGFLGTLAKIKYGTPLLLTEHGIYHVEREIELRQNSSLDEYQKRLWDYMFKKLSKLVYEYSDKITTLFELNKRLQMRLGAPKDKIEIVHNGVDIMSFSRLHRQEKNDLTTIGCVARVVPIKDIETFIRACKIISKEMKYCKFYIIGPTDENEKYAFKCKQLVELFEMTEQITFTGSVEPSDILDYYSKLDVFVLSSIREAQPLSVIEAMVAGIPIVATRVGSVPELIGNSGIIVPPKSPGDIAQGVMKICKDSNFRESIVKAAKEKALRLYDLKNVVVRYRQIYEKIVTRSKYNLN